MSSSTSRASDPDQPPTTAEVIAALGRVVQESEHVTEQLRAEVVRLRQSSHDDPR